MVALVLAMAGGARADIQNDLPYQTLDACLSENFVWPENCLNAVYRSCMGSAWTTVSDANLKRETCWTAEKDAWDTVAQVWMERMEFNMSSTSFATFQDIVASDTMSGDATGRFADFFLDRENPLDRSYIARSEAITARNAGLRLLDYHSYLRDGFLNNLPEASE